MDERTARADAQASLNQVGLVSLTQEVLASALISAGSDFEDNIQLASAESIAVSHLVTRNKKDFQSLAISLVTPEEWLALDEVAELEATLAK